MGNIALRRHHNLSTHRRIAFGTWQPADDPTVYGTVAIRMEPALAYIERFKQQTGQRLTVTALVGKAVAKAFEAMPEANAILRLGGIYLREEIHLSFMVLMREGEDKKFDLGLASIRNADQKSLADIARALDKDVDVVREGKRRDLEQTKGLFRAIPTWLSRPLLKVLGFLSYGLNLDLRWAGVPPDPFGSATISNIGSLGLEGGYAALVPYSRCPMAIAVGAVQDEPVVDEGQVRPGKVMRVFTSFDHRVIDGAHAAVMARVVRECLEDPFAHFDTLDP